MTAKNEPDHYSPSEAASRRDATIRNMIAMPPAPRGATKPKRKPSRPKAPTAKPRKKA